MDEEIANGGMAALHYPLTLDLTGFDAHSKSPVLRAKQNLIDLGMDSTERFYREWPSGELPVRFGSTRSEDLYELAGRRSASASPWPRPSIRRWRRYKRWT